MLLAREIRALGWDLRIATNDGSLGTKGFVTALLDRWLAEKPKSLVPEFFVCGPDGLLKAACVSC